MENLEIYLNKNKKKQCRLLGKPKNFLHKSLFIKKRQLRLDNLLNERNNKLKNYKKNY